PRPIGDLSVDKMRNVMRCEEGVEGDVDAFYRNLQLKHMRCDLGYKRIACAFVMTSRPENSWDAIVEYDPRDKGAKRAYVIGLTKDIGGIFIRPVQQSAALFADHIATGHYNETRSSDKRKKGIMLLDNKKALSTPSGRRRRRTRAHGHDEPTRAMEAAPRDILQARTTHASADDDFVIYIAKGEIDIRFRRQSDANKSVGDAELEQLADGHRARVAPISGLRDRVVAAGLEFFPLGGRATTTDKVPTQKKSNGIYSCWARSLRTRDAFPEHPSSPLLYFGFVRADWEPRHVMSLMQHIKAAATTTGVRVLFQTVEENDSAQVFVTESVLETIVSAGIGGEHLGFDKLTAVNLAHVFRALLAPDVVERASQFAQVMASPQDAVTSAVSAFYANLPLAVMTCNLLDPMRIAHVYDSAHQVKLSYEAHVVVRQLDVKYKPIKYSLHHPPRLSLRGLKDPVTKARELAGGTGPSGKDAPRLLRYTSDMVEDEDAPKPRAKVAKTKAGTKVLESADKKCRGKLNRY
ncbi:hypothetical protein PybrP1_000602, partial [[Pythium] brassicae (nom. inval.)]